MVSPRRPGVTPAHTTALVRQRLGVDEDPAALARFVEERVAGHPYFCEALVKAMQEAGIVRVQDGRAVFDELESLDMPATVHGAVLNNGWAEIGRGPGAKERCRTTDGP